jgi:OFA family oxalate/formate antiporter-like MFS transporter
MDYENMHILFSVLTIIVGLTSGWFVRPPESAGSFTIQGREPLGEKKQGILQFTVIEALKTRNFWLIWITWAFQGAAGMAMLTLTTSYGLYRGFSLESAALILMAFNMTNGGSRLVTGMLSDVWGSSRVMSASFLAAGVAYFFMPHVHSLPATIILAAMTGFAFGTLIAVTAPIVVDCFGLSYFGAIFGIVWSAFGFVSGLIGPSLCGYLLDISGEGFTLVFSYLSLCSIISGIFIMFVRPSKASSKTSNPAAKGETL